MDYIKLKCFECGKYFNKYIVYYQRNKKRNSFCSFACHLKNKAVNVPTEVIDDYKKGLTYRELSAKYNIGWMTVRNRILKLGISRKKGWHMLTDKNPTKGKGHTKESVEKIRQATIKQFSTKEARIRASAKQAEVIQSGKNSNVSSLEEHVAMWLTYFSISYKRQIAIKNPFNEAYTPCVDFLIDNNKAIEVNGTYYHSDPRIYKDKVLSKTQKLIKRNYSYKKIILNALGYTLGEIWEEDMKKNPEEAVKNTLERLGIICRPAGDRPQFGAVKIPD